MAGGVEPLGTAALLTPTDGAEDGSVPAVAASLAAFFAASYEALFFVTASSAAFFALPLRWLSSSPLPLWSPSSSPPLWRPSFFLPPLLWPLSL
jgi:hypothetical protein